MTRARISDQDKVIVIGVARVTAMESRVTAMEYRELVAYVEDRLRGRRLNPPLDERSGEEPADFLVKLYERSSDEAFKRRFGTAVAELLASVMVELPHVDYVSSLLMFCERCALAEAAGPIGGLIIDERLKGIESKNGDLYRQALLAFARLPQAAKWRDLWVCSISDSRYTAASFTALRSKGLDVILRHLPKFVSQHIRRPESLNLKIAIGTLYHEFDAVPKAELSRRFIAAMGGNHELERALVKAVHFHDPREPQDFLQDDAAAAAVR